MSPIRNPPALAMGKFKAGIITAQGIGDALIMTIIAYHLEQLGYQVTVFNQHLSNFQTWFERYETKYPFESSTVKDFDILILQHDNTEFAKKIVSLREENKLTNLYVLYTNYSFKKHGSIYPQYDFVYDLRKSMVENTVQSLKTLFAIAHPTKENGICIPSTLTFQKYPKRILLHPTSTHVFRNWPIQYFIKLAFLLKNHGLDPVFTVSSKERNNWIFLERLGFSLPHLPSLSDLSSIIYESGALIGNDSGPAHLASNLQILSLVLAKRKKHMDLWKPGWKEGGVILPSKWAPNIKHARLREKYWKYLIRPRRVFKRILSLLNTQTE